MFGSCCAPPAPVVWSAPTEGDLFDVAEGKTDTDTATESSGLDYRTLDNGVDSELCPSWMPDKDSDVCLQCDKAFTTSLRRTHCRRCRNLFCKKCTNQSAPILLYGIREDAKVCSNCFAELLDENCFIKIHRPLLIRGENFKKPTMMGLGVKIVELRLLSDLKTLVYDDNANQSKPSTIPLCNVSKMKTPGLTSFELGTSSKTYEFEADTAATQRSWVEALKMAVERARQPTLKETVHRERRERVENRYKMEDAMNRQRLADSTRENRQNKRSEIRNKYSKS